MGAGPGLLGLQARHHAQLDKAPTMSPSASSLALGPARVDIPLFSDVHSNLGFTVRTQSIAAQLGTLTSAFCRKSQGILQKTKN